MPSSITMKSLPPARQSIPHLLQRPCWSCLGAFVVRPEPFEVVPSDPVKVGFGGRELRTGPGQELPQKVVRIFDGDRLVILTKEPFKSF